MEFAALLIAVGSGAGGVLLRKYVSATVGRRLFVSGLGLVLLGCASFGFAYAGWISTWTAAGVALAFFMTGIVVLPLGLALGWTRSDI